MRLAILYNIFSMMSTSARIFKRVPVLYRRRLMNVPSSDECRRYTGDVSPSFPRNPSLPPLKLSNPLPLLPLRPSLSSTHRRFSVVSGDGRQRCRHTGRRATGCRDCHAVRRRRRADRSSFAPDEKRTRAGHNDRHRIRNHPATYTSLHNIARIRV